MVSFKVSPRIVSSSLFKPQSFRLVPVTLDFSKAKYVCTGVKVRSTQEIFWSSLIRWGRKTHEFGNGYEYCQIKQENYPKNEDLDLYLQCFFKKGKLNFLQFS